MRNATYGLSVTTYELRAHNRLRHTYMDNIKIDQNANRKEPRTNRSEAQTKEKSDQASDILNFVFQNQPTYAHSKNI